MQEIVPYKMTEKELLELAALAETYSSHPIAVSLREAYGREPDKSRVGEVTEYPGLGLCAVVDGPADFYRKQQTDESAGRILPSGSGTGAAVHVACRERICGHILISDTIRKDAGRLIRWLHRRQLAVVMLTGDNEAVAENVAAKLKIESVYAELMPEDKVEQLEEFRKVRWRARNWLLLETASMTRRCLRSRMWGSPWAAWAQTLRWRRLISY